MLPEHAVNAYEDSNNCIFQGRLIQVLPAMRKRESLGNTQQNKTLHKQKKLVELKSNASNEFNWNSLFMNVNIIYMILSLML